jgi:hypothetical protein
VFWLNARAWRRRSAGSEASVTSFSLILLFFGFSPWARREERRGKKGKRNGKERERRGRGERRKFSFFVSVQNTMTSFNFR